MIKPPTGVVAMIKASLVPVALLGVLALAPLERAASIGHASGARRAFYYWKTQWSSSPILARALADNGISRLYVRFFDVDWDEPARAAQPVAPLRLAAPLPAGVEIVAVVFVANRVFVNVPDAEIDALADHVRLKVQRMAEANGVALGEVQLDCDWSDGTRARYFRFLERIGKPLHAQRLRVSSTIRLHQVKYAARTGVPPVDRGMLMFYNFGPLRADAPRSSIFNADDAARYTAYIRSYALPLDLALPLFSWAVHSRDDSVIGLIDKLERRELEETGAFRLLGPGRYRAERSWYFHGHYFMEGDELRVEETGPQITRQAAAVAARSAAWNRHDTTIALFDLDERNLRRYATSDLQAIFAAPQ